MFSAIAKTGEKPHCIHHFENKNAIYLMLSENEVKADVQ